MMMMMMMMTQKESDLHALQRRARERDNVRPRVE